MSNQNKTGIVIAAIALVISFVAGALSLSGRHAIPVAAPLSTAAGSGVPTVYDNVNLLGTLKVPVTAGNPLVVSSCPAGSIDANGVCEVAIRQALTTGTTTPCVITSPVATSTLMYFGVVITTGTSTAQIYTLATSSSAFATTSLLQQYAVPAGAANPSAFTWSPSVAVGGSAVNIASSSLGVMASSTNVVVGVQGGTGSGTGSAIGGFCSAEFYIL